jgi:hypothetical protein
VEKIFNLIVFGMLLLGSNNMVHAQIMPDVPNMKGKWVAGGTAGFGMSGDFLYFSVSPQLGYRLFNRWETGVRLTYDLNYVFDSYYGNRSWHYFGGAIYTNFQIYKGLYFHLEDELLYKMSVYDHVIDNDNSRWFNSIFVGGGYRQYVSDRAFVYFSILYDISFDFSPNSSWISPYSNPLVWRMGYCVGF